MDGRVLTILKYTPGSGSLPDPSLVKGNTKQKVLVPVLQPRQPGVGWGGSRRTRAPSLPSAACSSSELLCQTQDGTFKKQTC